MLKKVCLMVIFVLLASTAIAYGQLGSDGDQKEFNIAPYIIWPAHELMSQEIRVWSNVHLKTTSPTDDDREFTVKVLCRIFAKMEYKSKEDIAKTIGELEDIKWHAISGFPISDAIHDCIKKLKKRLEKNQLVGLLD